MLNIDPKQRPNIVEILNKSFIKKKVISFMGDILSGKYNESNDIEDVFSYFLFITLDLY